MRRATAGGGGAHVLEVEGVPGEAGDVYFHDGARVDDQRVLVGVEIAGLVGTRENLEQRGELGWLVLDAVDQEGKAIGIDECGEGYVEYLIWWTRTGDTRDEGHFPRGQLLSFVGRK